MPRRLTLGWTSKRDCKDDEGNETLLACLPICLSPSLWGLFAQIGFVCTQQEAPRMSKERWRAGKRGKNASERAFSGCPWIMQERHAVTQSVKLHKKRTKDDLARPISGQPFPCFPGSCGPSMKTPNAMEAITTRVGSMHGQARRIATFGQNVSRECVFHFRDVLNMRACPRNT